MLYFNYFHAVLNKSTRISRRKFFNYLRNRFWLARDRSQMLLLAWQRQKKHHQWTVHCCEWEIKVGRTILLTISIWLIRWVNCFFLLVLDMELLFEVAQVSMAIEWKNWMWRKIYFWNDFSCLISWWSPRISFCMNLEGIFYYLDTSFPYLLVLIIDLDEEQSCLLVAKPVNFLFNFWSWSIT
jgi:hypothetical protein